MLSPPSIPLALAAFTTGAAWAGFNEDHLGRLHEGYLADITVLSENPLTVAAETLPKLKVILTIVGGEIVYVNRGSSKISP